jgi:hypothetical protein
MPRPSGQSAHLTLHGLFQKLRPIGITPALFAVTTKQDADVIHGCMSMSHRSRNVRGTMLGCELVNGCDVDA